MRTWSDSPFDRTVRLSLVDRYSDDDVIARDNGESFVIFEPPGFEGWLVKLYKPDIKIDHNVLGRLIELPETMPPDDLALVDRSIAWPVARVVNGYRTVGTIMAKAKQEFFWDIALLGGRTVRKTVEIDHLANTSDELLRLGFPVPSTPGRLGAMRNVVACAALFERYDVVYADWSFANAFWSPGTQDTLIIDVDASGIGERRFVETPNWEDPLMGRERPVTTHTDRYKVALLVARAVTGQRRDRQAAVAEMERLCPGHLGLTGLLRRALDARAIEQRPTLAELHQAIEGPGGPVAATPARPPGPNVTVLRPWSPPVTGVKPVARAKPSPVTSTKPVTPVLRPHQAPPTRPARTANARRPTTSTPPAATSKASPATFGYLLGIVLVVIAIVITYLMITHVF